VVEFFDHLTTLAKKRNMAKSNPVKKPDTKKADRNITTNKKGNITQSTPSNKKPIVNLEKKNLDTEAILAEMEGDAPQEVTSPPQPAGNKEPKKVSTRRPIYHHRVLPEWGKALKVGTELVFTLNEKVTGQLNNDSREIRIRGKVIDGVDDSAREAFKLSKKTPPKNCDGLKFWKVKSDGKTLRDHFMDIDPATYVKPEKPAETEPAKKK